MSFIFKEIKVFLHLNLLLRGLTMVGTNFNDGCYCNFRDLSVIVKCLKGESI